MGHPLGETIEKSRGPCRIQGEGLEFGSCRAVLNTVIMLHYP